MRIIIILIASIWYTAIYAQESPLKSGFGMLESGAFEEAVDFFSEYLVHHPTDRTARLCLGRAIGLSGNPDSSVALFENLLSEAPGDVEVRLNLAEAQLWRKDFDKAEELYTGLWKSDSASFPVNLGYANTLSAKGKNDEALRIIDRALDIEPSNQALISKKYILLGLHASVRDKGRLLKAHQYLDQLDSIFPADPDLLISRAVLHLLNKDYSQAMQEYSRLYTSGEKQPEALLGLSYTNMVMMKRLKSLQYAREAMELIDSMEGANPILRVRINYINVLGINGKYNRAHELLDSLILVQGQLPELNAAKARLHLWAGELELAAKQASYILDNDGDIYETLLGAAEISLAQMNYKCADVILDSAIVINPDRRDAHDMQQRIYSKRKASFELSTSAMHDNSGNRSLRTNFRYNFREIKNMRIHLGAGHNIASGKDETSGLQSFSLSGGISWAKSYRFRMEALSGLTYVNDRSANQNWLDWSASASAKFITRNSHSIGLTVDHVKYDYNVELIRNDIKVSSLSLDYQKRFRRGAGVYSQSGMRYFSNQNAQLWAVAAVYRELNAFARIGVNYNYSHFTQPGNPEYFSPGQYNAVDGFFRVQVKNYDVRKWSLAAQIGSGMQRIDSDDIQWIYRWELAAGGKAGQNAIIEGIFSGSNAASRFSGNYTYYNLSIRLNYSLNRKKSPIAIK